VRRPDWAAIAAVVHRDLTAVRRSKPVMIPMLALPVLLLVVLPLFLGVATRAAPTTDVDVFLQAIPGDLGRPVLDLPERERLIVLVYGYLLAPLFLIVPLMVSSVLAADTFAGEKERRTLETVLHLPIDHRDLFLAKILGAFLPAVAISWLGFAAFAVVANGVAWPVVGRLFVPTSLWVVMIGWVGPGVAALGLAVVVRVSARARSVQEANQIGGAIVLPMIFVVVGQSTGLLLVNLPVAVGIGVVAWSVAGLLISRGARRFTRDQLAAAV
jgi:ABC-2 type transport system permease protein